MHITIFLIAMRNCQKPNIQKRPISIRNPLLFPAGVVFKGISLPYDIPAKMN